MQHFKRYSKEDVLSLTALRKFETKLGEEIQLPKSELDIKQAIEQSTARFVLLGVVEDIGVKANSGRGGAATTWIPFLQSFLNVQSNDFFSARDLLLLGHFDFGDIEYLIDTTATTDSEKMEAFRKAVVTIDDEVEHVIKIITANKKIPIVIGGGHNNAYPLIKGAAKGWHATGAIPLAQINCVNLDAHTDYRPLEGRHSGNPFRYAEEDGYLQKYCAIGVHENYIPQIVWMDMVNNPFIDCITFEDIFIHEKRSFLQSISHATGFTADGMTGIELDLDAVENTLSSACSPVGVSPIQARKYIAHTAYETQTAYLHICEGAVRLSDGRVSNDTGKYISYLVSDFIKAKVNQS